MFFSGQSEKAIDVLQNTLKWYRGDHEMSLFMGLAYAFNKDAMRAVEEFEKSLKWDPDYPLAHFYLGVQVQNSDPSLARRHLEAFLRLTRDKNLQSQLIEKAEKLLKKL
ncbi:hypothetical protein OAL04_01310 [Nitrospinae bacterium]|nr:hypothetical protein [Nitrospinota bacterium]